MSIAHELNQLHASVCKGLADPKRLLIINVLRDGEMSVGEICEELELPQANVSQHLAILRNSGVVQKRVDGTTAYYSLIDQRVVEALDLMSRVMEEQLATRREAMESKRDTDS